jgi:hypothetical protein
MIVPGRKYTFEELRTMREDPSVAKWAAKGYVWRQELDGTMQLIHWTKGHMDNEVKAPRGYVDTRPIEEIFPTEPIAKRTPQERKDSLISRWWAECKKAGTVPGMTSEQLTEMFGREFEVGVTEITYADIERMAGAMLQQAENQA